VVRRAQERASDLWRGWGDSPLAVASTTIDDLQYMRSMWPFLSGLLLFAAPAAQAQDFYSGPYYCSVNPDNTTVTIMRYGGSGGAVIIPDTLGGYVVTGIGEDAFYFAENVTNVTIPSSVTNISDGSFGAFYNSANLAEINVATNNPAYMSLAGVLFNKTQTELVAFPEGNAATSYTIPDGVVCMGADAFALCANLTSVTFPSSLTSIAGGAFSGCHRLAGVVIPDSVTSIGDASFAGTALTNLTISDSVTNLGGFAFSYCGSLTSITLGDGLTSIENSTFQNSGLNSITIPNSVTNLGTDAFWYSGNLTTVTIGSGVTSIGLQVFSYCPSLTAFNVNSNNPAYSSADGVLFDKNQSTLIQFPDGSSATSYTLPNTVATIADWAFSYCPNLASVTIDTNATLIGNYAFLTCPNLTNVTIPGSVTSIEYQAFCECSNLTDVAIANGSIGGEAFAGCAGLTNITLGNGVTSIGEAAFDGASLTSLTLPASLTSMGAGAFTGAGMTNLTIPNSVGSIGEGAFSGCGNLASVTIGDGVTNLGEGAFGGCASLSSVTIGDGVTIIGSGAFSSCPLLTSITIPGSMNTIGGSAFYYSGLTSLTISSGVTNIGAEAFLSCTNLTAIYFLGNAPSLGLDVFTNNLGSTAYINVNATVYYAAGTTGWGTNFGGLPTVELNGIAFTATPTNGTGPLSVNFTSASVDSAGNPISSWNWNFGDGASSAAQNPSHTYAAAETFYPVLVASNSAGQTVLGLGPLAISLAPPRPGLGGLNFSGGNLSLNVSNGLAGGTYCVLMSADLTLPLSQWTPVVTNVLNASGDFSITIRNPASQAIPQQFYMIQCYGSSPPTNVVISNPGGPQP
jgi:hypothetical protein